MKYVDRIDNQFVRTFAEKFFKKYYNCEHVSISKRPNYWQIVGIMDNNSKAHNDIVVNLYDFHVSSISTSALALASKHWQVAMYKNFGDEYLSDLKEDMSSAIMQRANQKIKDLDNTIQKIKDGHFDDRML